VNHPLRVGGDRLYLQGHGYAPTFTVTFPNGQKRTQTLQFRPDNARTLLSSGTIRVDPPAGLYPPDQRRKHQLAITGLFAPTQQMDGKLLSSSFPAMNDPAVAIDIYRGDAGLDTGRPQSLFSIDTRLIEQKRLNKLKRVNLARGQEVRLDDGTVVRFDDATEFVNLQVSHDPGQVWVLVFALTMMGGLLVSLVVRRRRVWARITPSGGQERSDSGIGSGGQERSDSGTKSAPGTVNVELGGLARTDNSGWGEELDKLSQKILTEGEFMNAQREARADRS
jgi:cytochrome c biogenesis protein